MKIPLVPRSVDAILVGVNKLVEELRTAAKHHEEKQNWHAAEADRHDVERVKANKAADFFSKAFPSQD